MEAHREKATMQIFNILQCIDGAEERKKKDKGRTRRNRHRRDILSDEAGSDVEFVYSGRVQERTLSECLAQQYSQDAQLYAMWGMLIARSRIF